MFREHPTITKFIFDLFLLNPQQNRNDRQQWSFISKDGNFPNLLPKHSPSHLTMMSGIAGILFLDLKAQVAAILMRSVIEFILAPRGKYKHFKIRYSKFELKSILIFRKSTKAVSKTFLNYFESYLNDDYSLSLFTLLEIAYNQPEKAKLNASIISDLQTDEFSPNQRNLLVESLMKCIELQIIKLFRGTNPI